MLVVAPHPDDDVLGCGGTLALAAGRGAVICVVFVTDGARSHVGSRAYPPERLRDLREDEARAGLAALGVHDAVFLREPDAGVARDEAALASLAARLRGELVAFAPTAVFGPAPTDVHGDHVATARALRAAMRDPALATAAYLDYAVWDVAFPPQDARAVDVPLDPDALAAKLRALAAHRSQLGLVITDAERAFGLPPELLARSRRPVERFAFVEVARDGTGEVATQ